MGTVDKKRRYKRALKIHTVWPREADALELLKKISEGKTAYVSKALLFYEAYKDPINEPAVPAPASKQKKEETPPSQTNEEIELSEKAQASFIAFLQDFQ